MSFGRDGEVREDGVQRFRNVGASEEVYVEGLPLLERLGQVVCVW